MSQRARMITLFFFILSLIPACSDDADSNSDAKISSDGASDGKGIGDKKIKDGGPSSDEESLVDSTPDTLVSCGKLYGNAPGYIECVETDSECHFFTMDSSQATSCDALCTKLNPNSKCISASASEGQSYPQACMVIDGSVTCSSMQSNMVCVCERK